MIKGINRKILIFVVLLSMLMSSIADIVSYAASPAPKDTETQTYIIKYKDEEKGKTALKSIQKKKKESNDLKHLKKHAIAKLTKDELQKLKNDPNIDYIEQDSVVKKASDTVTTSIYQVHAPQVHDLGVTGIGVNIAILDSGVDTENSEVHVAGGVSFVPNDSSLDDPNGHGTIVAGIIGALKDDQGLVGVAPNANLFAVKVLDQSGIGTYSQVIDGIEWAIDHDIDVICMSFVGENNSQALQDALQLAYDHGIVLVAAAGNDGGDNSIAYPAKYSTVIAVGAVDQQNARASFSNKGPELALVAPGVDVQGLSLTTSYSTQSGTSLATAHVAGVAALLKSSNNDLNNQQIRQALQEGATPLGDQASYGYGLVDAAMALVKASNMETVPGGGNSGGGGPGGGDPEHPGVGEQPELTIKTVEDIVQEFAVTEEWVQQELDAGNTAQDIYTALLVQKIEGRSYSEVLSEIKVKMVNDSDTAESEIASEALDEETAILRSQNDTVIAAGVTEIAPDNTALNNVKLGINQAPFSISSNQEQISTLSGSLSSSVTDLTLPGRNGLSFELTRVYDSNAAQFYDMDTQVTTTPVSGNQLAGWYVDFNRDKQQVTKRYKVSVDMARFVRQNRYCATTPTYNNIMVNDPPHNAVHEEIFTTWFNAFNRKDELSHWYSYQEWNWYPDWTPCTSPDYYSWRYFDANHPLTARIIENDSINNYSNKIADGIETLLFHEKEGSAEDYNDARAAVALINNNKGTVYEDSGWSGSDNYGYIKNLYSISANPNPTIRQYNETVTGIRTDVKNITAPAYDETRFAIGKGWRWNVASVENKGGKQYMHLGTGGAYEISGNALKGYPWQDIYFGVDYSVSVNGEQSVYLLKNTVSGLKQYFNGEGLLIEIADPYGNTITFTYSQILNYGKQLTGVTDAIGNSISIAYSSNAVVLSKSTGNGTQTVTYNKTKMSGKEVLNSVTDPLNRKTTYSYSIKNAKFNFVSGSSDEATNSYALLTGIKYPTGTQSIYNYETAPTKRMMGRSGYQYQYRLLSANTETTLSNGTKQSYNNRSFSYAGDISSNYGSTIQFSTTVTDANTRTKYNYRKVFINDSTPDALYQISTIQESIKLPTVAHVTEYSYDEVRRLPVPNTISTRVQKTENNQIVTSTSVTEQRTYDNYGNILTMISPLGIQTNYTYDPTTHWLKNVTEPQSATKTKYTEFTYNGLGSPNQIVIREGGSNGSLLSQTNIAYDSFGNPISVTVKDDSRNNIVQYEYSPTYGNAYLTKQTFQVTDIDGVSSTITQSAEYNNATKTISKYIDGKGNATQYTYDLLDRVTQATFADSGTITFAYNNTANEVTTTGETGIKSKTKWNPLGWKIESGVFENGSYKPKETLTYDASGRVTSSQDARGNSTTYTYDAWGRTLTTARPGNNRTTVTYDDINRTVTTKDAEANEVKQTLDILGRLIKTEELRPYGTSTAYTYDYAGNVLTSTDAYNRITSYQYDALNRLIGVTDPESRTTQYKYSLASQLTELQYPDGKKSLKSYDQLGRLIQNVNPLGEAEKYYYDANSKLKTSVDAKGQQLTYQYNVRDLVTTVTGGQSVSYSYDKAGKRLSMTDLTGTTSYDYDTIGQLIKMTYPDNRNIQYQYDAAGNRTRITDPFGQTTNYTYDSSDRLTYVKSPTTNDAAYKYKLNGLLSEIKQLNGVTSTYTYEGLRVSKIEQKNGTGALLNTFAAEYDRNGNITSRTDNGVAYSYTYDALNRIKTNSQNAEQYAYDSRGNRQTLQTELPPEFALNQYEYDYRNQLTKVTKPDGTAVTYKYNGDGQLYERTENNQTIRYYNDGSQVVAEGTVGAGGSATLKARYIRGIGLVAQADAAGTKAYYLSNLHGDIVELRNAATGNNNARLNQYTYDIWGNPLTMQENVAQPFRYSGEMWDNTTKLQYLRARWYDPSVGRFINEDSYEGDITNPLSLNRYAYVHNNPINNIDPSGHYCVSSDGNWAHGGECGSGDSIYLGEDSGFQGREIIENGVITEYLDTYGPFMPRNGNYWDNHYGDQRIFKDHAYGFTVDTIYGGTEQIGFLDDPLFYVFDGVGLIKGAFLGIARAVGRQIVKEAAEQGSTYIAKEVAELGENKINHILKDKHLWGNVVDDGKDWGQVSAIMSKVMRDGTEGSYKSVYMKTLQIGDETVAVTYAKLSDGTIKVSDGWVLMK